MLGRQGGDVHEADGLGPAQGPAGIKIALIGPLQKLVLEGDVVDLGQKGGVAAVIGPVGVDHADLGDGGVPALVGEVPLAEGDVVHVHGEAVVPDEGGKARPVQGPKTRQGLHLGGDGVGRPQGLGLLQGRFPGLHRVDDVFLDLGDLPLGQGPVEDVDLGGADQGPLPLGDELDALGRGIRPLVELARQILHGEHRPAAEVGGLGGRVHLGLREHGAHRLVEEGLGDVLPVVPVQQPEPDEGTDAQKVRQLPLQGLRLLGKARLLFHEDPIYHITPPTPACRCPGDKTRL